METANRLFVYSNHRGFSQHDLKDLSEELWATFLLNIGGCHLRIVFGFTQKYTVCLEAKGHSVAGGTDGAL